jgi:hypothetical protein
MLRPKGVESDFFPRSCMSAVAPSMCSVHDFIDRVPLVVFVWAPC